MMEGFADIEGPVSVGQLWLMILLAILCTAAAVLIVRFLWKRRKKTASQQALAAVRSPLEIALGRLEQLKSSGETLEADPYTVEVSDIVRDYLESCLNVPAKEQTSEEFLLSLQAMGELPPVLKEHMPEFLNQCDWVKFARQSLGIEQRHNLLKTAETVVDVTDTHLREQQSENLASLTEAS